MSALADLYKLLEFDKILAFLKQHTISTAARDRFDTLEFMRQAAEIKHALQEVSEFRAILDHDSTIPLQQIWDTKRPLETARIVGSFLAVEPLVRIAQNLETSRKVRAYLNSRRKEYPKLWLRAENISLLRQIEDEIQSKIDPRQIEVKDSATPVLAKLRKRILQCEQNARRAMDKLFRAYSEKGYLQEELVTIKDGRLVLPVKLQNKGRVKGLVHDHSASGATLFIEPFEVVEINNEIGSLRRDEAQEIERILRELTGLIREQLEIILMNMEVLIDLDFIQAKAYVSRKLNCSVPDLEEGNEIEIFNGRHPLLVLREEREKVVPLNLQLASGLHTLVITGPNAGGKTVALKTVGLLALMLQSGIPIPVDPDSRVPIFHDIFVDIGDFQSIEQDLSSFSSHLTKIHHILQHANEKSLVLVDEIGVGTDPAEGSALAMAFLEELTKRSCTTIVTTHHGALKEFAYNTTGVENGSMEFDSETLRPTYRFRLGIPGSSYALEIAKRLGISDDVLARAREMIGSERGRLERLILDLEKKVQHSEKLSNQLELENTRLKGLAKLYGERHEAIKKNERELKRQARAEAQDILNQANASLEQAIREIREGQANRRSIIQAKTRISNEKDKIEEAIEKDVESMPSLTRNLPQAEIRIGQKVYWEKQKANGKVVSGVDGSNKVMIQVDNFKFRVPVTELFQGQSTAPVAASSSVIIKTSSKSDLLPEIDLRGNRLEEAIANVDKFLDDAMLAGWPQVRLIHGKGTGVLRKGIDDMLTNHPRVKSKKIAAWNQGDIGVTVVELK